MLMDLRVSPSGVLTWRYPCQDRLSVANSAIRLRTGRIEVDSFMSFPQNSNCPPFPSLQFAFKYTIMFTRLNQGLTGCELLSKWTFRKLPFAPCANPAA